MQKHNQSDEEDVYSPYVYQIAQIIYRSDNDQQEPKFENEKDYKQFMKNQKKQTTDNNLWQQMEQAEYHNQQQGYQNIDPEYNVSRISFKEQGIKLKKTQQQRIPENPQKFDRKPEFDYDFEQIIQGLNLDDVQIPPQESNIPQGESTREDQIKTRLEREIDETYKKIHTVHLSTFFSRLVDFQQNQPMNYDGAYIHSMYKTATDSIIMDQHDLVKEDIDPNQFLKDEQLFNRNLPLEDQLSEDQIIIWRLKMEKNNLLQHNKTLFLQQYKQTQTIKDLKQSIETLNLKHARELIEKDLKILQQESQINELKKNIKLPQHMVSAIQQNNQKDIEDIIKQKEKILKNQQEFQQAVNLIRQDNLFVFKQFENDSLLSAEQLEKQQIQFRLKYQQTMNYNNFLECKINTMKINHSLLNINTKRCIDSFFQMSDNQNPTVYEEEAIKQQVRDHVTLWNDLAQQGRICEYDDLHVTQDYEPISILPAQAQRYLIDEPFCDGFHYYFNDDDRPLFTMDSIAQDLDLERGQYSGYKQTHKSYFMYILRTSSIINTTKLIDIFRNLQEKDLFKKVDWTFDFPFTFDYPNCDADNLSDNFNFTFLDRTFILSRIKQQGGKSNHNTCSLLLNLSLKDNPRLLFGVKVKIYDKVQKMLQKGRGYTTTMDNGLNKFLNKLDDMRPVLVQCMNSGCVRIELQIKSKKFQKLERVDLDLYQKLNFLFNKDMGLTLSTKLQYHVLNSLIQCKSLYVMPISKIWQKYLMNLHQSKECHFVNTPHNLSQVYYRNERGGFLTGWMMHKNANYSLSNIKRICSALSFKEEYQLHNIFGDKKYYTQTFQKDSLYNKNKKFIVKVPCSTKGTPSFHSERTQGSNTCLIELKIKSFYMEEGDVNFIFQAADFSQWKLADQQPNVVVPDSDDETQFNQQIYVHPPQPIGEIPFDRRKICKRRRQIQMNNINDKFNIEPNTLPEDIALQLIDQNKQELELMKEVIQDLEEQNDHLPRINEFEVQLDTITEEENDLQYQDIQKYRVQIKTIKYEKLPLASFEMTFNVIQKYDSSHYYRFFEYNKNINFTDRTMTQINYNPSQIGVMKKFVNLVCGKGDARLLLTSNEEIYTTPAWKKKYGSTITTTYFFEELVTIKSQEDGQITLTLPDGDELRYLMLED